MWLLRSPKERREKCGNCNYWKPTDPAQERGICGFSLGDPESNWTSANDFCAAWTPRPMIIEQLDSHATNFVEMEDSFEDSFIEKPAEEDVEVFEDDKGNNELEAIYKIESAREIVQSLPQEEKEQTNVPAIIGFVLGLLSLFIAPFILGILGLIFSLIGMSKSAPNRGFATAGLILSVIGIVFGILSLILGAAFLGLLLAILAS
jgi:hypothetical protein